MRFGSGVKGRVTILAYVYSTLEEDAANGGRSQDVLTASSTILAHFANALSTYSSLHHTVRDSMKSVRTREEALDDLRRRRRRVGASAEAAEKKLNKMNPENKNLGAQTDALNKLREEMRALDGEIVREETELGDYKRKCTRDWMGFKFGGLVECCEKGVVRVSLFPLFVFL